MNSGRVLMPLEATDINSVFARRRRHENIVLRHVFLHATVARIAVQSAKRAAVLDDREWRLVSPLIVARLSVAWRHMIAIMVAIAQATSASANTMPPSQRAGSIAGAN